MTFKISRELTCILSVSVCFLILFSADGTVLNIQKLIISSIEDDQPGFKIEGYTMSGLVYTVFAISVWFGPYINYAIGSKPTMVLASVGYLCYSSSFLTENAIAIITGAVITGVSAGVLWPAQGCYVITNSSPETIPRNFSIFWFLFATSYFFGNIFLYFTFHGQKYIDQPTRRLTLYILTALCSTSVIAFMFLPKSVENNSKTSFGPIKTLKKSWKILFETKMLWLTVAIIYEGLQMSFNQGIYGSSIGFTLAFGDSVKELVAFNGMFMSLGLILGSLFPLVIARCIRERGYARRMTFLSATTVQIIAFATAFINIPDSAVFGNTTEESFIHPNAKLAMLGSLLISFGTCCLATQVNSFIGEFYRESSAEACALYMFVKSVLASVAFYSSSHLGMHSQLAVLAIMAVVGTFGFFMADRHHPPPLEPETNINNELKKY